MYNIGLGSWPARRAQLSPRRTAIRYLDRSYSYAQLAVRVARLARRLADAGVTPGRRVAYLGPNHPAFVESMFATFAAGGIFVPLNARLSAPEIDYMLDDAAPAVFIHAPENAAVVQRLTGGGRVGTVVALADPDVGEEDYEPWLNSGPAAPPEVAVSIDDIALILYTSGTTGRPKGAMLSHENLIWNTYHQLIGIDVTADEVALVAAPMFHCVALANILLPTFLKGGCALIAPHWNVDEILDVVERDRVTWMFGVPAMFSELARSARWPDADLSSLRNLMVGGSPVPSSLIAEYQARGLVFCQGYGLTETGPSAAFVEKSESVRKAGSAGAPMFFGTIRIERPDGSDAAVGERGEVLIAGPNITPGYWNRPDATANLLTEDGWLHSGDLGSLDEDGYLFIVDRLKDMFVSGGENVYPAEVEDALLHHAAVSEAAVVGVADDRWGEVGRAFVVCRPGTHPDDSEFEDFLVTRLAKYKVPAHIVYVPELPRTASGKVRKADLRSRPLPLETR